MRHHYYKFSERGFANEYDVFYVRVGNAKDKALLDALVNVDNCDPNSSLRRVKRASLDALDWDNLIHISKLEFEWRANDSEVYENRCEFENIKENRTL